MSPPGDDAVVGLHPAGTPLAFGTKGGVVEWRFSVGVVARTVVGPELPLLPLVPAMLAAPSESSMDATSKAALLPSPSPWLSSWHLFLSVPLLPEQSAGSFCGAKLVSAAARGAFDDGLNGVALLPSGW